MTSRKSINNNDLPLFPLVHGPQAICKVKISAHGSAVGLPTVQYYNGFPQEKQPHRIATPRQSRGLKCTFHGFSAYRPLSERSN